MEDELTTIVDLGGKIKDVVVKSPCLRAHGSGAEYQLKTEYN